MTLHPGDIILTGTPAGVGAARGGIPQGGRRRQNLDRGKIGTLTNKMA